MGSKVNSQQAWPKNNEIWANLAGKVRQVWTSLGKLGQVWTSLD